MNSLDKSRICCRSQNKGKKIGKYVSDQIMTKGALLIICRPGDTTKKVQIYIYIYIKKTSNLQINCAC